MATAPLPPATEAQVRAIGTADLLALVFEEPKPLLVSEWPANNKEAPS